MIESPESQAIHEAVKRYTDIQGPEGALLAKLVETIAAVLAIRWKQIREAAEEEENGGKFAFTLKVVIDRRGNTPEGEVMLSFTPKRVKEAGEFQVEDTNQGTLALDVSVEDRPRVVAYMPQDHGSDQRD